MACVISRFASWVLIIAGVFNVVIWPRFAKAIVDDSRAWSGAAWESAPTSFFWVHAVLIVSASVLAICVLVIGIRSLFRPAASDDRPVSGR